MRIIACLAVMFALSGCSTVQQLVQQDDKPADPVVEPLATNGTLLHLSWPFPAGVTGGYYRARSGLAGDATFAIVGVPQPRFLGIFTNRSTTTVIPTTTGDYYWDAGSNYMIECAGHPPTTNHWRQR